MKANREQFEAYVKVQKSNATNMWDVAKVIELADVLLSRDQCLDIMYNFSDYQKKYGDVK